MSDRRSEPIIQKNGGRLMKIDIGDIMIVMGIDRIETCYVIAVNFNIVVTFDS